MFDTKLEMAPDVRERAVMLLQGRLADTIDFVLQAKQAHWNVKGLHFRTLHLLFDEIYEHAVEAMDLIGERIVQLGGMAEGICQIVTERTSLPRYPAYITHDQDHLDSLSTSISILGKQVRQNIHELVEWKDDASADILVEILRQLDKDLWMVESHIPERGSKSLPEENRIGWH
jgi:starvation-inducible DNA-binding protein